MRGLLEEPTEGIALTLTTTGSSGASTYDPLTGTLNIPIYTGGGSVGPGTINEIAYFDTTTSIASLAVATYPSLTELSYVKGVNYSIQTQLNAKQASDTQLTSLAGLSYTGNALKVIRVNAGETDFELATVSGGPSFGTDNQIPYTNAGGTDFDYSANLTFNGTALALAGNQTISQGTITTDVKALDISSTWNNAAVAFTGIKLNTTQTASASTSLLMDLQRAGTSVFKVGRNGAVTIDPGLGWGSGSGNPVLTLRSFYGTSSFYGDTSSILHLTGSFQVDSTLYLGAGIGFQATGQTVNFNSGNITNLNSMSFNGSLGNIKMYHDYNGFAPQADQGIIMRYANRSAGVYPRAAFQVYKSSDSTEIPFLVSSQGFAWLRNSKTDEVVLTIKGATSQTANLQNWIDSSDAVLASVSASGDISVPDEAYGSGWNGSTEVPTKNALYDKIETIGSGQTLYEAIVATSGGDYTTLGAAITAGKTRIFVRNGTYSESAISTSTADLSIIGESPLAVLSFGTASCTFSGARINIQNISFVNTTAGVVTFSGANARIFNCKFSGTATTTTQLVFSGAYSIVEMCTFGTYGDGARDKVTVGGDRMQIRNCTINHGTIGNSSSYGFFALTANRSTISGCTGTLALSANDCLFRIAGGDQMIITGNNILVDGGKFIGITNTNSSVTISNNYSNPIGFISHNSSASTQGMVCTGNNMQINGIAGAYFTKLLSSGTFNYCNFSDNVISFNASVTTAIQLGGTNNIVSNNIMKDNAPTTALVMASGSDNNIITGNQFMGSTVTDSGTGNVSANNI